MRRRGYLLVEVFVALTILAALFALVIQMVSTTARERRATERRAIALEHAANLLERASAIPFEKLSAESLREVTISADDGQLLPESDVRWTVDEDGSEVPAKRVGVELTWRAPHGRSDAPVRLVTWAFPRSSSPSPPDTASPEIPSEPLPAAVEDPS
jgi:hypothetical protein